MSLLEKLTALTTPAPAAPDFEDFDDGDGTTTRLRKSKRSAQDDDGTSKDDGPQRRRIFRVQDEDDEDPRYTGKKSSRAEIFDNFEPVGLAAKRRNINKEEEEEDDDDSDEDDDGDEDDVEDEDDVSDEDLEENEDDEIPLDDVVMRRPTEDDASQNEAKREKAASLRAQLAQTDRLLLLAIRVHGLLAAAQKMPRGKVAKRLDADAPKETRKKLEKARRDMSSALRALVEADDRLLATGADTEKIVDGKNNENGGDDDDDEEIPSSSDEEEEASTTEDQEKEAMEEDEEEETSAKKTQLSKADVEARLAKSWTRYDKYRRSTLSKWDERTRLSNGGEKSSRQQRAHDFSAFDGGALEQLDRAFKDETRLIQRTRQNRSNTKRIGETDDDDADRFDDADFYQQLLREIVDLKTAGTNGNSKEDDPIAMSRMWLEANGGQKASKVAKDVDRRATKARKIRYAPIPKLVAFVAADTSGRREGGTFSQEQRNRLFASLFT